MLWFKMFNISVSLCLSWSWSPKSAPAGAAGPMDPNQDGALAASAVVCEP